MENRTLDGLETKMYASIELAYIATTDAACGTAAIDAAWKHAHECRNRFAMARREQREQAELVKLCQSIR